MITKKRIVISVLVLLMASVSFAAEIPSLTAPVMDAAGVVDDSTESELNRYLTAVSDQTGVQIAVLTVPALDGESIEEFSMRAAEKWKLGQAQKDNGALLTVAMEEHTLRIEVGYGLEGLLTDTKCGLIIRNVIAPQFKNGDYTQGIVDGVMHIADIATEGAKIDTNLTASNAPADVNFADVFAVIWFIFIVLLMITTQAGVGPLGLYWWLSLLTGTPFVRRYPKSAGTSSGFTAGGFSSSGFHSSGFSGGSSFHGGGGGFGGGGASGRW